MRYRETMGVDSEPTDRADPNGYTPPPDPRGDFTGVVRAYQRPLFYFILSLVNDRHRAEDLAQEVFLTAYRRRNDFVPGGPVAGWLWGIARNLVMAEYRRGKRRPSPLDQETLVALADAFVEAQSGPAHTGDWLAGIDECLGKLDEENRGLLAWRYRQQMSMEEIASQSGLGLSALKMRFMRLRHRLADCLQRRRGKDRR